MEKNKKIVILVIAIIVAIFIWMPKGRREAKVLPQPATISTEKAKPQIEPGQGQRSEFSDWGRNPFAWPEEAGVVFGLKLSGIIWDEEASYAIINGAIIQVGDKIAGKTVKRIERDKVILTNGLNDYTLRLP